MLLLKIMCFHLLTSSNQFNPYLKTSIAIRVFVVLILISMGPICFSVMIRIIFKEEHNNNKDKVSRFSYEDHCWISWPTGPLI
jgi:hypothetical protein